MILGLGVGFYLGDLGTDLNFSVDQYDKTTKNFTEEIQICTEELYREFSKMTPFQSEDLTKNFERLDFLRKFDQKASNCFNREQHFGSDLKQFSYMRNNFILYWTHFSIYKIFLEQNNFQQLIRFDDY